MNTGLDPDNLPTADKTKMDFGSGGNTDAKAWKDIWGAGQSVAGIHAVETTAALGGSDGARIRRRSSACPLRLNSEQLLAPALSRGLAGIYLVSGDEPLLVGEAVDAIRAAARAAGYADRTVLFIDRSFDWNELRQATQSLSLFCRPPFVRAAHADGKTR